MFLTSALLTKDYIYFGLSLGKGMQNQSRLFLKGIRRLQKEVKYCNVIEHKTRTKRKATVHKTQTPDTVQNYHVENKSPHSTQNPTQYTKHHIIHKTPHIRQQTTQCTKHYTVHKPLHSIQNTTYYAKNSQYKKPYTVHKTPHTTQNTTE